MSPSLFVSCLKHSVTIFILCVHRFLLAICTGANTSENKYIIIFAFTDNWTADLLRQKTMCWPLYHSTPYSLKFNLIFILLNFTLDQDCQLHCMGLCKFCLRPTASCSDTIMQDCFCGKKENSKLKQWMW